MTVNDWLEAACADADRRGLPELKPLLGALAAATKTLRAADWNEDAADRNPGSDHLGQGSGGSTEGRAAAEDPAPPTIADTEGPAS